MTMFNIQPEDKDEIVDEANTEFKACQIAKHLAKETGIKHEVYESEAWDEAGDPGTLRWTLHPDGTEEAGHMGSRQFA